MKERKNAAPQNDKGGENRSSEGRRGGRGAERQRIARSPARDAVSRRLSEGSVPRPSKLVFASCSSV